MDKKRTKTWVKCQTIHVMFYWEKKKFALKTFLYKRRKKLVFPFIKSYLCWLLVIQLMSICLNNEKSESQAEVTEGKVFYQFKAAEWEVSSDFFTLKKFPQAFEMSRNKTNLTERFSQLSSVFSQIQSSIERFNIKIPSNRKNIHI